MQKMLVCGALALVACGGGQKGSATAQNSSAPLANKVPADTQPKSDMDVAMDAMKGFRDKICACVDEACAQQVSAEMTAWSQEITKKYRDGQPKITDEQTKQLQAVAQELGTCMMKAMTHGAPPNQGNNPCGGGP